MERIRATLWVIVVASGALLAACGGGAAPAGLWGSGSPLPEFQIVPEAVNVVVKPHALSFSSIGTAFAKKVVVSEKGYKGKFVEHTTCKGIAKASPRFGKGPKLTVKVTPLGSGTCAITFQDAKKHKAKLSIVVSTTKPTPTPSPTPYYTPTPTPCASCPTPTPGPTPTPNAGTIFVTYTASTAHPNVVAYDAQGNKKSTGTWGNAGSSPQGIAWAPGDLNWFYVVNGGSNTVKVYSSSGGQLSSFFTSVTAAGAIAYPSGASNLLYVTSTSAHTIHAYDEDGNAKAGVTFPSSGIDTFPGGLAYDSNMSRLYVANTTSGKVEYYSTSGSLGSSISAPGGCTCSPATIAFDPNNDHIYVWWSGTGGGMFAYDESGGTVSLTGSSGSPFSGLSSPSAIVANTVNGYLYIADGTGVKVFDATGTTIGISGAFEPGFSATSANGITIKP